MERNQKTLASIVNFTGKGLHSGRMVQVEISPASANTGIVFQRTDTHSSVPVLANVMNVSSTDLCTTIGSGANSVSTIEHLMSAFAGLGIDNAIVRLNAPELPIMDGSAAPFLEGLVAAGVRRLAQGRRYYIVKKPFEVRQGDRVLRIEPARKTRFKCSIEFSRGVIGSQSIDFNFTPSEYLKLANARTFCYLSEVNAIREAGLALGGSLENAIVVTDTGIMNREGLRSPDEFVRHKLLDCIGDLALLGAPIVGSITVHKPGHSLHSFFMNELLKQKTSVLSVVEPLSARDLESEEGIALPGTAALYG